MSLYDSTDNMIGSLGCFMRGMTRPHDGLMMLLWLGEIAYLVLCTIHCDVISVIVVFLLVHCDVSFCTFPSLIVRWLDGV
jgi:hypothetical protein